MLLGRGILGHSTTDHSDLHPHVTDFLSFWPKSSPCAVRVFKALDTVQTLLPEKKLGKVWDQLAIERNRSSLRCLGRFEGRGFLQVHLFYFLAFFGNKLILSKIR